MSFKFMLRENADDKYKSGNTSNSKLMYIFKMLKKVAKDSVNPLWSKSKILNKRKFNSVSLDALSLK